MAVAEEIQKDLPEDKSRLEGAGSGADNGAADSIEAKDPYIPQTPYGPGIPRGVYAQRVPGGNSGANEQAVEDAAKRLEEQNNPRSWAGFVAVSDIDRAS